MKILWNRKFLTKEAIKEKFANGARQTAKATQKNIVRGSKYIGGRVREEIKDEAARKSRFFQTTQERQRRRDIEREVRLEAFRYRQRIRYGLPVRTSGKKYYKIVLR